MEETNSLNVYDKSFDIDDTFIIVFDDMTESLGIVSNIDIENKIVSININNINREFFINDMNLLILKTDDYNIIDIELVIPFVFNDLDDNIEISLTKDIYPNIEIITEEKQKYDYTDIEKRESLITSLVISMKIYDDPIGIKNITNISQIFIDMIKNIKEISFNHFKEILYFDINENLPDWIVPICSDYKRLYFDKTNITEPIIQDDFIQVDFDNEINEIYEIYNSEKIYNNIINIYNNKKYKSIRNKDIDDGYILKNYNYDYFRNCLIENTCTGLKNDKMDKYNVDTRRNYKKLEIKTDNESYLKLIHHQECNIINLLYISDKFTFRLPFKYDSNI